MRFDRPTTLPNGLRVRFRLPHATDRRAVRELFARAATPIGEAESRRVLRFTPHGRVVLCAVAPWAAARRSWASRRWIPPATTAPRS